MYYVRVASYLLLSLLAIKLKNESFHAAFAAYANAFEIVLIFKSYMTVS